LLYLVVALPVLPLQAAFGPCETTTPSDFRNTIACAGGACAGDVIIIPEQKSCSNSNEDNCTNEANSLRIDYAPKAVDQGWTTFVACCGLSIACTTCAATLGFACAYTSGGAWFTCVVAAGCGVCGAFTGCDYCCYTKCEQDMASRIDTPGGSNC
jgi:hypothetical protein